MMLGAHLLVCQMSSKHVWSWHLVVWEPPWFLRLEVQGVEVLILLGSLLLPSVAAASQQDF
jgi:hypothetical protein